MSAPLLSKDDLSRKGEVPSEDKLSRKDELPLEAVVAVGRGRVIGKRGAKLGLPWHLPEDLRHFKRLTLGRAIVMGRTTFESIGRPLPKRRNIVLSRSGGPLDGCEVVGSLAEALALVRRDGEVPVVVGGASVYEQALPLLTTIHLTEVDRDADGDVFFPEMPSDFVEVERRAGETEGLTFVTLRRPALLGAPPEE